MPFVKIINVNKATLKLLKYKNIDEFSNYKNKITE